jgi:hypothetical protein
MCMFEKYLKIETISIVFVGDFNPIIFQPAWLALKGLIREDEAEKPDIEVIHNQIVKYEIGSWLNIEITKNRCEFKTSKVPYFDPMKDLAIGIFSILKETPIYQMGINHIFDLSLLDSEKFYKFGAQLTPLNIWDDVIDKPKLLSLEVNEDNRKDGEPGSRRVRINSSDKKNKFGVTVNINDHFNLKNGSSLINVVTQLEKHWKLSRKESFEILTNLFNKIEL